MTRSTVSQEIYAKFIKAATQDERIPQDIVEQIEQLLKEGKLASPESIAALRKGVEEKWRVSNP